MRDDTIMVNVNVLLVIFLKVEHYSYKWRRKLYACIARNDFRKNEIRMFVFIVIVANLCLTEKQ